MRKIKLIYDFFRLWIMWGDRKEAWQDAKFKNDPEFQRMMKDMDEFGVLPEEDLPYIEEETDDRCPNCGEYENIHTNYDWTKKDRPVEEYLCNECGTYFKPKQI